MGAARRRRFLGFAAVLLLGGCGKERVMPYRPGWVDAGMPLGWDEPTEANGYHLVPPLLLPPSPGYQSAKPATSDSGALPTR